MANVWCPAGGGSGGGGCGNSIPTVGNLRAFIVSDSVLGRHFDHDDAILLFDSHHRR